jgi:L-rhamnose mutarotase
VARSHRGTEAPGHREGRVALLGAEREGGYDFLMLRKAFRMSVDDGRAAEYERRHRPIWPELERVLFEHGVRTYSIFLDEATNDLFAYAEIEDEATWRAIANTDVCRRWWRHMREIMPANPDDSPIASDLREVFHIDQARPFVDDIRG